MIDLAEQVFFLNLASKRIWVCLPPDAKLFTGETEKGEWQDIIRLPFMVVMVLFFKVRSY